MSVISFSVPCSTHKDYFFCGDTIEFSWWFSVRKFLAEIVIVFTGIMLL
jgi:hypothetical protein